MDFKVLMAHAIMSGARVKDIPGLYLNDPKVGREDLCAREFDYVALGHIHQAQKVDRNIYYSGSVERISFAEVDENKYDDVMKKIEKITEYKYATKDLFLVQVAMTIGIKLSMFFIGYAEKH